MLCFRKPFHEEMLSFAVCCLCLYVASEDQAKFHLVENGLKND